MRIDKKIGYTLFALTLLITSLLLINMNGPTSATPYTEPIYLHGPPLAPIHMNSNKTLTPIHMHSLQPYQEHMYEVMFTQWHELYPNNCTDWTLTSFNDTGELQGELDANDQIDMVDEYGNKTWFHVDRTTITLNLSSYEYDETIFVEFKGPPGTQYPLNNPICTYWHEVDVGFYNNVFHIIAWNDTNIQGVLDFCDDILLTMTKGSWPGYTAWYHVDGVSNDLILREKIIDPICTWWHGIYPDEYYCNWYHLESWENQTWYFSPGDQIDMIEEDSGNKTWYFVDRITVTLNVSSEIDPAQRMKIEFKTYDLETPPDFEEMYEVFKHPIGSKWHEIYPDYCNVYNLTWWDWDFDDNCNGVLDVCDYIWLQNITNGEPSSGERWHVDDITYDLILNKKISDPECTWWHELYPDCCVNEYHIIDWEDNNVDELLSPCDNVTVEISPTGLTDEFHVKNLTLTLNLTILDTTGGPFIPEERIYIELAYGYDWMYYAKIYPLDTPWEVVCPTQYFGMPLTLKYWDDNCNGVLSYRDVIGLEDLDQNSIIARVDELAVDMIIEKEEEPPPPPPPQLYWKESYPEYAPSGVPDFDQNQGQWGPRYCAPTAVANSLWWMDSRFHPSNLLTAYSVALGEHDPSNVQPFIQHLAWLMDTDGQRTLDGHLGTWTLDMETGIAQYLSWSGVNPLGDVNGDGTVDNTDYNIVVAANNTTPLSVSWDMAADIWPETVTGPYTADNVVNQTDIDLVTAHMGENGQFHEWTILHMPDFFEVAYEVEECEDVILVLGFWYDDPQSGWIRLDYPYEEGSGHAVTVAGINSTSIPPLIAISDPDNDAFESGLTPGRSPVPHVHNPPGNTTTHNNASLVSHDIYNVTFGAYPTGTWALQGYIGAPPGYIAVVESAVITSPLLEEVVDIAVTNVVPSVSEAYPLWTIQVNVTVLNNGTAPITCPVTAYYNASTWNVIGTQNVVDLAAGANSTLTFNWDLASVPICNRRLKANATLVGDVNLANNEFVDGSVKVKKTGDVNNDGSVTGADIVNVLINLGPVPPKPIQCDINGDGSVTGADIVLTLINLGGYVCT